MKLEDVRELPIWDRYFYFVAEREKVRLAKESGAPRPWTDDETLATYRFCNMRRMDDWVSQWLLTNWYQPYFDHPNMLVATTLARFFNLPSSLKLITTAVFQKSYDPDLIIRIMQHHRDAGNTVFNGAYIVRGNNDGTDKITAVVNTYTQPLAALSIDPTSMERTWLVILPSFGIGSFTAGQIVADLRWAVKGRWGDRRIWAPLGPGSKRGMNRLYERDLAATLSQVAFLTNLRLLITRAQSALPASLCERMEAQDWQNTLCEFDKYERALHGEGRPKQFYKPRQ